MAKYRGFFTPDADAEVLDSYLWGVEYWGEDAAKLWLRELYSAVFRRLTTFPLSCPLAPENFASERQVRHFLFGRYRVLFEIKDDMVIVLQLVGPFKESPDND